MSDPNAQIKASKNSWPFNNVPLSGTAADARLHGRPHPNPTLLACLLYLLSEGNSSEVGNRDEPGIVCHTKNQKGSQKLLGEYQDSGASLKSPPLVKDGTRTVTALN